DVSCGITESAAFENSETLVKQADLALYEAKRSKRRIVIYAHGLAPKPSGSADKRAPHHHQRLLATTLARAVDTKDAGTRSHCETVSALCVLISQELGLRAERIERLRLAALLHDVGKIGVDELALRKPGPLDAAEAAAISEHVEIGHHILLASEL